MSIILPYQFQRFSLLLTPSTALQHSLLPTAPAQMDGAVDQTKITVYNVRVRINNDTIMTCEMVDLLLGGDSNQAGPFLDEHSCTGAPSVVPAVNMGLAIFGVVGLVAAVVGWFRPGQNPQGRIADDDNRCASLLSITLIPTRTHYL